MSAATTPGPAAGDPAMAGSADACAAAVPGRLRWRCRRGMKELDLLLQRWLTTSWAGATATERAAFERLLERQDPQLVAWVFGRERPADPELASLVDAILAPRD